MAPTLKPIDVYNAYPEADLIPLPKPEETETFKSYTERVDPRDVLHCGDTLYAFILFELNCAEDANEADELIERAIRDLEAVKAKIDELRRQHS